MCPNLSKVDNKNAKSALEKPKGDFSLDTPTKVQRAAVFVRIGIEWLLGACSCLFLLMGLHRDITKDGLVSVVPKVVIFFSVCVSMYSWRQAILNSLLSRKEEHLFFHKTTIAIIIGLFGAISGNPWFLFFLTSRSLSMHMFVLMFFTHSIIWGSTFFMESALIKQVIFLYPIIAAAIVNLEEILSDKGMHCAYRKSKKYLLGLSMTFVSFCIIGFIFSPHAEVNQILFTTPKRLYV
ncbi:hypothetical protein NERG_00573 [Nematocida ausubeli]|uniref:Uncharacterized protein n=1 Tax=Nematocida ausubeli (strain ATCC PRA-371 / ERTm2) TaxID=1913371 RepID=H8ZAF2_NEMA1|nr:hypothetical protein NERG_00573 [Nematocida ausubeli]